MFRGRPNYLEFLPTQFSRKFEAERSLLAHFRVPRHLVKREYLNP